LKPLRHLLGIDYTHASWAERLLSGLGGGIGILLIWQLSQWFVGDGAHLIVASMGASAVLLFAVPHGRLSQPWQLLAGHLVSATIGVACARVIGDAWLAAPLAVGLAILAMRLLACVHPPGGATALSAVIGGAAVRDLGFQYVLTPVLLNAVVLLAVAVLFNYPFRWRRYPAALAQTTALEAPSSGAATFEHADLVYALSEMDTFMDVSEQDLQRIYQLAMQRHAEAPPQPRPAITANSYYSNGRYGADWQVREVTRIESAGPDGPQVVSFRVVAGQGQRYNSKSSLAEFQRWAKYRVVRNETSWQRVERGRPDPNQTAMR
jgi:CBS-domain-containing membrane protein